MGPMRRERAVGARPAREVERVRASAFAAERAAAERRHAPVRVEDAVVVVLEVPARAVVHHVQVALARHRDQEQREHQREPEQDGHRLLRRPRGARDRHGETRAGTAKRATRCAGRASAREASRTRATSRLLNLRVSFCRLVEGGFNQKNHFLPRARFGGAPVAVFSAPRFFSEALEIFSVGARRAPAVRFFAAGSGACANASRSPSSSSFPGPA